MKNSPWLSSWRRIASRRRASTVSSAVVRGSSACIALKVTTAWRSGIGDQPVALLDQQSGREQQVAQPQFGRIQHHLLAHRQREEPGHRFGGIVMAEKEGLRRVAVPGG